MVSFGHVDRLKAGTVKEVSNESAGKEIAEREAGRERKQKK